MIVRNLILADASVHDKTPSQQTALQLAAESNLAEVASILLAEGIDYSAVDSRYVRCLFAIIWHGNDNLQIAITICIYVNVPS